MTVRRFSLFLVLAGLTSACSTGEPEETVPQTPERTLIYVVNTGEPTLSVVDHETREVETLPLGAIAHGQIPSHSGEQLFVTTEDTGEVIAIDTRTQEILWRVVAVTNAGDQLHQPSLTLDDRTLFAPDAFASRMAVVDVQTGKNDGEVAILDGTTRVNSLHNSYLSGDGEYFYVAGIHAQRMAKVRVSDREIVQMYELEGQPRPFALLSDQSRAYVQYTWLEGFVELDLETGAELRRIDFGNAATESWDATVTLLKPKSHGIGLTPDESQLWATSTMADEWRVYSVPELDLVATIPIPEGNAPNWITFTPDGDFAYVSNTTFVPGEDGSPAKDVPGTVTVIDARTYEAVQTLQVGPLPKRIHAVRVPAQGPS
ncbi:MAG: YncE family protein [Myxococcota bacterium]